MEWFWRLVDRLQKGFASSALRSFSPVDWIFLCAIVWGLIQGSRKGFSDMLGKLFGIFLVSMLTLSFYSRGADRLCKNLPVLSIQAAEPLVFFLLAVFLWFSASWSINVFGKFLRVEAQGPLKTLGGAVFGILHVVLWVSFLAQFLLLFPIPSIQKIFKPGHTYTGYAISKAVPDLHKLMMSSFHRPARRMPELPHKTGG